MFKSIPEISNQLEQLSSELQTLKGTVGIQAKTHGASINELVRKVGVIESGKDQKELCVNLIKALYKDPTLRAEFKQLIASLDFEVAVYAPSKVNVVPGVINAEIDWEEVTGAEKYFVYYEELGKGPKTYGPVSHTKVLLPGLNPGTTYEVFVRSALGTQISPVGEKIMFTTKTI